MDIRYNMERSMSNSVHSELTVLSFEETDDGGAIVHLSLSPLAVKVCVEQGILAMLMRHIDDEARRLHERKDEDGTE